MSDLQPIPQTKVYGRIDVNPLWIPATAPAAAGPGTPTYTASWAYTHSPTNAGTKRVIDRILVGARGTTARLTSQIWINRAGNLEFSTAAGDTQFYMAQTDTFPASQVPIKDIQFNQVPLELWPGWTINTNFVDTDHALNPNPYVSAIVWWHDELILPPVI